jgi:ribonuclease HI
MMSTTDVQLLKIMRQFEKEEAAVYDCTIEERDPNSKEEGGGFLRWFGPIPDLRSHTPRDMGNVEYEQYQHPGETELHDVLQKDLSIFPRALKATQELGLSIWMNDCTPCLRHKGFAVDFTSSKISRPAMWITQEIVRRTAWHSFQNAAKCAPNWKELQNNPSANHFMNWATSRYDDALLRFAIGARLYTLNTPNRNKLLHPETAPDIPCPMCGKCNNPNLHHILSECMHGGPATMLDRHNRVACAVRKAIEIGNPNAKVLDDKTVSSFVPEIEHGLRQKRPDLMFESAEKRGRKTINKMYLVEIATPWSYEDEEHSALQVSYDKKVRKYAPIIADIERKRPGVSCEQITIVVSPTGAFMRESQEEFAKVSKLTGGKLAIHKRCIVDAAIQGAYEQWRQFGRKLALSAQLEALNPGATGRKMFPDHEAAEDLGMEIVDMCPEISDEVVVLTHEIGDNEVVGRDVGQISPIELHQAAVEENRARAWVGLPPKRLEAHPDGHKGDEDDGDDAMFGFRAPLDQRSHIKKKTEPIADAIPFQPTLPAPPLPPDCAQTEIEFGFRGHWDKIHVPKGIREEELNKLMSDTLGIHIATPDYTGSPIDGQQFRFFPDVSHSTPIWITLRQGTKRQNLTMVMRVSKESTQSEIEDIASDYWSSRLEFKNFPKAFDSTVTYWMHPRREDDSEPEIEFPEPETLDTIPHVPTPMTKAVTCTFTRSHSSDDLKSTGKDPTLQKSADTLAHWDIAFGLQHVMIWAPEDAPEETVIAKAAASVDLKTKGWNFRREDHWRVFCTDPENVPTATIHFGSLVWNGKYEPSYSVDQLIASAQDILEIPGTWKSRNHFWEGNHHRIECEQTEDSEVYPTLEADAEVRFDFEGAVSKAQLPAGTDRIAQATKAQELFGETVLCSPLAQSGDHFEIHLTRPKLFPITILYKGDPTKIWCHEVNVKAITAEATRVFGRKFSLQRKVDQPGLVYEADVPRKNSKPPAKDSTKTRKQGKIDISSPSLVHMRAAGPQPLDFRAPVSRPIPGAGGITLTYMFPTKSGTLYNVPFNEATTRDEMIAYVCDKAKLPPLHDDYFEAAPLDWFAQKRLSIRYQFPRRDLSTLMPSSAELFVVDWDPTSPVLIETDGACSGNPGVGGWGAIVAQNDVKVELHGPNASTTNNEMELQALAEALDILPKDFQGYVTIETDSENAVAMMSGKGRRWQIDNFVMLKGNRTKNRQLVDRITTRLQTLQAQFLHIDAHKGDQWNERADELARMGRDAAASWPHCSFDVILENKITIPFKSRQIPPDTTTADLLAMLANETHAKLPDAASISVYDSKGVILVGDWTSGKFSLVHDSQPPPSAGAQPNPAQAPDPVVIKPVHYGVFAGRGASFVSTRLIDSSKMTMDALIAEFNRAVPDFGNQPRFFVGLNEVDPTEIRPGQAYSVYPKKISRPSENRAMLGGPVQPPRVEGPMIHIQWKVSDVNGSQLCPPGNCSVPAEIGLLQLFKTHVLTRYRISGIQIIWGNHFRAGSILEIGKVTDLEQDDLVEIIVDQGVAPQATQMEVKYTVGSEQHIVYVPRDTTIEQLTQRLAFAHKGRGVHAIASEGLVIAPEDSVENWIQRTADIPFQAVIPKTVQVIVEFRGQQKHLTVQDTVDLDGFKALARNLVGLRPGVHVTVIPLGLDDWEIRAGFVYWMAENRQMEMHLTDTKAHKFRIKLAGDSSLDDAIELFRQNNHTPIWDEITIRRADDAPFWIEDKGHYLVEIMYKPEKDTRPKCNIKVVCSKENQVFFIPDYRAEENDPVAVWTDICAKYGFINPGNHLRIEGTPDSGLVTFTYRISASIMNVKIQPFQSRTFKIVINDSEVWDTGEILSPAPAEREAIWDQLSAIRALPHWSQFHFSYAQGEIPITSKRLPVGHITVVRTRFDVKWRLELFSEEVIQQNMHAGQTIQEAWALLHNQVPRLYPDATFNYAGNLQPGMTVTTQVMRADVRFTVAFEVKDHGWITYPNNDQSNMIDRQAIHAHYAGEDPRIPPLAEYIEEDTRPYHNGDLITFNLKKFGTITDLSNEGPGRNGGDNGRKFILPPIVYSKPPINTADPSDPKNQGSLRGPVGSQSALDDSESDSCPTDSEDDTPDTGYAHRLARINHAIHNKEPIMVVFVGMFQGYCDRFSQCEFRLDYAGGELQAEVQSMKDFFESNWQKLRGISLSLGGDEVPGSLTWTRNKITDEVLITDSKRFGKGLKVRFQHTEYQGIPMSEFEATFVVDLTYGLSVAFPAAPLLTDATLMQYMSNLSASWDGQSWSKPWQLFYEQKPWRKSDTGEIVLEASTEFAGTCDPHAKNPRIPFNAAKFPEECEIFSDSDISRTLKFARNSGWPFRLSCASTFDGTNAITVTYLSSLANCEDKVAWYWNQFVAHLNEDGMTGFPAMARNEATWRRKCFIGDHCIHVMLVEQGVHTTEVDGPPCFFIYAPNASLKIRAESIDVAHRMITMCYNAEPIIGTQLHGKFWALIESINGGEIPVKHLAQIQIPMTLDLVTGYNKETFMDGLAAEPYRISTGKFCAQFKRSKPYAATIAIEKGVHAEHGYAILFEQENRRCLLTRQVFGLSDEQIFWTAMKDWASFEPRQAKPRRDAGILYYPSAWSHMVEEHWDFIHAPKVEDTGDNVPMGKYASAAARLAFTESLHVDVEAPQKSQDISYAGAMSRRCPVQDAQDYWTTPKEQAQEECVTVLHGFAPGPDVHNVDAYLRGF